MIIVLDPSASLEILMGRECAAQYKALMAAAEKTISSELYRIETANALWKYYRAEAMTRADCGRLLELAECLIDEYFGIAENNGEAMYEACRLNHSTYDMLYFTLARRKGAMLLTRDEKLRSLAKQEGLMVNH